METKEKIQLSPEEETMLITLYSKVSSCPQGILSDPKAPEIFKRVDYEFSELNVPLGTRLTVCLRARQFDDYVRRFLERHPQGVVLHLGCGLDTRCARVDNGQVNWYDLDLPEVIDLRRKFFEEGLRYHMIPSSVTDLRWLEQAPDGEGPVFIAAEGLMMYLEEAQVKELILALHQRYPGSQLAFDAFSTLTARRVGANPSLRRTGAVIRWGIDDAYQIERWAPGIRLEEEWYFTDSAYIDRFGLGVRITFLLAGLFKTAKKAHRVLLYTL